MTRREYHNLVEPTRFSRSWWARRGRNLLWVTLVTVLVWIYADVEFTDEMELSSTIRLRTAPASGLVLRSASRVPVSFHVQGRRSSLERLEQRLRAPEAVISFDVSAGDEELATRDVLNRDPFFQDEGLTALSASPRVLRIRLDRKVHQGDIPVRLDYTGAVFSEVTIQPPKVGIHVAESDWENIRNTDPNLRTVQVDLKQVASDKPFVVELVRKIGGVPVEPDQPTVTVTVKIATLTETEKVTVPVQVVSPPEWLEDKTWREYALSRRDRLEWRVTIQVSGTRKDLDQLKAEDVRAYVVLTEDDKKPVSWLTRPVEVRLPRALNLRLLGPPPTVSFKLEKVPSGG
jgi:hypothetical protein